ncbi:hypothetical protein DFH11DRAFT_1626676 [Phellopilus nigrolimitatus]|nr:hypothetical protein DFH11DRAFT_1626676 [Phellopilus nigrolimitatus]
MRKKKLEKNALPEAHRRTPHCDVLASASRNPAREPRAATRSAEVLHPHARRDELAKLRCTRVRQRGSELRIQHTAPAARRAPWGTRCAACPASSRCCTARVQQRKALHECDDLRAARRSSPSSPAHPCADAKPDPEPEPYSKQAERGEHVARLVRDGARQPCARGARVQTCSRAGSCPAARRAQDERRWTQWTWRTWRGHLDFVKGTCRALGCLCACAAVVAAAADGAVVVVTGAKVGAALQALSLFALRDSSTSSRGVRPVTRAFEEMGAASLRVPMP